MRAKLYHMASRFLRSKNWRPVRASYTAPRAASAPGVRRESTTRPRARTPLDPLQEPSRRHAEDPEGDDAREDVLGLEQLERFPQEEAESGFRRLDLRDEDQDQRHAGAETQAGEDVRQGAGQDHLDEDLKSAGAEIERGLDEQGVDRLHPRDRVDEHQEEHADGDGHDLRRIAEPEPEQEEREERGLRDRIDGGDPRIEHVLDPADGAGEQAEHDAGERAVDEALDDAVQAHEHGPRKLSGDR